MTKARDDHRREVALRWLMQAAGVMVSVLAYAAILQWVYRTRIAPLFAYAGFDYHSPRLGPYAGAIALSVALGLILPQRIRRPSDFVLWVLYVLAVAPCLLISQYNSALSPSGAVHFALAVSLCFAFIRLATSITVPRLHSKPRPTEPNRYVWVVLICLSVGIYAVLAVTSGIHIRYLTLFNVYSVRSDFLTAASGFPLLGYLVPVLYAVVNPVVLARGILTRQGALVAVAVLGQLLMYVTTGQKTILFSFVGIAATIAIFRRTVSPMGARVLWAAVALAVLCAVIDGLTGSAAFTTLFTRRSLVVPGVLASAYVSVFAHLPKTHFSEFLPTSDPFPGTTPAQIVGRIFVGNPGTSANVSWLGHGYASWGYAGIVVESIVVVMLLWAVDSFTRGLPLSVSCSLVFMPTVALASSSVFTTILTNGFLAAIIVAWQLPSGGWERVAKTRASRPTASAESRAALVGPHR